MTDDTKKTDDAKDQVERDQVLLLYLGATAPDRDGKFSFAFLELPDDWTPETAPPLFTDDTPNATEVANFIATKGMFWKKYPSKSGGIAGWVARWDCDRKDGGGLSLFLNTDQFVATWPIDSDRNIIASNDRMNRRVADVRKRAKNTRKEDPIEEHVAALRDVCSAMKGPQRVQFVADVVYRITKGR